MISTLTLVKGDELTPRSQDGPDGYHDSGRILGSPSGRLCANLCDDKRLLGMSEERGAREIA